MANRFFVPPLIVPDTNVIVSGTAIASSTPPSQIIQAWRSGEVYFALSPSILEEVTAVLARPYFSQRTGWTSEHISSLVKELRKGSMTVPGTTSVDASTDPRDNQFFACALEAEADYIVSGDTRHVLPVGFYQGIRIVSPREFVNQVLEPLQRAA
jgi:uncharacterized protein